MMIQWRGVNLLLWRRSFLPVPRIHEVFCLRISHPLAAQLQTDGYPHHEENPSLARGYRQTQFLEDLWKVSFHASSDPIPGLYSEPAFYSQ